MTDPRLSVFRLPLLGAGTLARQLLLLTFGLLGLLALGWLGAQGSAIEASATNQASVDELLLVGLTNQARRARGLPDLAWDPKLHEAAETKVNHMLAGGYFDHTSPAGVSPWQFIRSSGYTYTSAGENLAIGFDDNAALLAAWLISPTHRANILDPAFQEIAIATAHGTIDGREGTVVVQMFGDPASLLDTAAQQILGMTDRSNDDPTETPVSDPGDPEQDRTVDH